MRSVLPQLCLIPACLSCGTTPPPPLPILVVSAPAARIPGKADLQPAMIGVQGDKFVPAPEPGNDAPLQADLITAGFIDGHAHPSGLGRRLDEIDLVGVATYAEALSLIRERAPKTGWVLGRGWDQNDWSDVPNGGWPLAADLDALFPDRPVALRRVDGHATWANTATLTQAGLTASTPDPIGGRIVRAPSGAPSGVLIDTAADALTLPKPTVETVERWLLAAQTEMLSSGLVGVHDMGIDDTTLAAYRKLDESGRLKIRVFAYLSPDSDAAQTLLRDGPSWGSHLSVVGIKAYADGALGSRGAHLSSPYHDEPGSSGFAITPKAELQELATRCLRVRTQLAVHAIGDQAVTDTLDAFEGARRAVPGADDVPLRVEHAQIVRPSDRPRFATLGVVASMQPTHATSDMPWAPDRLGQERVSWGYAWRSLTQAGAVVPLGSDFPVESADPALGLWSATRRTDLQGKPEGGWGGEEALTLVQAIDGFTTHTWSALGQPSPTLAPGQTADLTLWRKIEGPPEWVAMGVIIDGELTLSTETP